MYKFEIKIYERYKIRCEKFNINLSDYVNEKN